MDAETYPDAAVKAELANWVFIRLDLATARADAKALGVAAVPTAVAVTPEGQVLGRLEGFVNAEDFAQALSRLRAAR
ncbi:MAG: hypothetical protein HYY18_10340 [Planctomycetes bacterium]|nr:hypothetical protein [Planctomycetota bacterium]